jgi:hypothetical protein
LEAKEQILSTVQRVENNSICAECLRPSAQTVLSLSGDSLCSECASTYYAACATCHGLVPSEEVVEREAGLYCSGCSAHAQAGEEIQPIDDTEVESLVAEFVALHAEEKRIGDRMGEIKEQLKQAAAAKPRVGGAVTLRSEAGAVKCSYSIKLKCDAEKVTDLEAVLDAETFASLFETKVTVAPQKKELEAFLSSNDREHAEARKAVISAVERTEVPTLTVVRPKK